MKIFLDPGHGGHDPGTSGNGLVEKNVALAVALQVRQILVNEYGASVRMSRTTDIFISLDRRAEMAREWGANLFVSIHCNGGVANGFETFRHTDSTASRAPQQTIHNNIFNRMPDWVRDRGLKSANFRVLSQTYKVMYSILTENLFLGHKDSADWLRRNFEAVARGHAVGIASVANLKPIKTPEPPKEETMKPKDVWDHRFNNGEDSNWMARSIIRSIRQALRLKIAPNRWMKNRWSSFPDDGYTPRVYIRAGYGWARAAGENTEEILKLLKEHIGNTTEVKIIQVVDSEELCGDEDASVDEND